MEGKRSEEKREKNTILEQIKEMEKGLSTTKYNKKTQGAIGLMKAKIAKLKEKQEKRSSGGKKGDGYSVKRTGDATVILIGYPSTGKSTLLNKLTNANSEVGAYDFTTLDVIPGLLEYKHSKIQILDVPGIVRGAAAGTGRGKEVLACIRSADLVLFIVDVNHPEHMDAIKREVYEANVRINQEKPIVKIVKTEKNGIRIGTTLKLTKLDQNTIKQIMHEFRYNNADIVIRSDISDDQFIDCIEDNKKYIPGIVVLNKIDLIDEEKLNEMVNLVDPDIAISAEKKIHIDELKNLIYQKLRFIRIFTKEVGKEADMNVPMIMKSPCKVKDLCEKLHKDFVVKFKYAKVFGPSAKFPGQKFLMDHVLKDMDLVEIHLK
jgi:small GTP-binding protein